MVLVGFGDLGQAIAHYGGFATKGFHITAIFDNDPTHVGKTINDITVQHVDELETFIRTKNIRMAIVAVPAAAAQQVADTLIKGNIRAILNYAPITLNVPKNVHVQYIDPVAHLQKMTYYLA
jgi:redox-sensing transcriptional repressor